VDVSDEAVKFLKRWEGFSPKSHWDYHQWSAGYGSVSYENETITEDVAEGRLRDHLRSYAANLSQQLIRTPTPEQSVALLSAAYNLGLRGTQGVVELFNAGDIEGAAFLLRHMDHAGGKRLPA
jgi:GH24 family phage-related lysozyme (muramidase)